MLVFHIFLVLYKTLTLFFGESEEGGFLVSLVLEQTNADSEGLGNL